MRIAYIAKSTGNGFYRGMGPMTALEKLRGHDVRPLARDPGQWSVADVRDVDVLHIHRNCEERAQVLAREAKRNGAVVVWDNDDDMGAMPKSVVTHKHFSGLAWEKRLQSMRRLFQHVDLVTTPSARLARRFGEIGAPRTAVIENHVPDQFIQPEAPPHDGVTICWVAGLEHAMDVERVPIREALQQLLDERPDVRVVSFGLGLGLRGDRYHAGDVVPLFDLCPRVAQYDVGIAPLADLEFNLSRSNVKLKEYAAAGLPWLASPIGPYAAMGERAGGRLVPDHRWVQELGRLLDKPRERRKLAKSARKWVAGETLTAHVDAWEAVLSAAITHLRAA